MPAHDAHERSKRVLARRKLWAKKTPFGMAVQLLPALVRLVDRQKKGCWIGDVNEHWQAKLAAGLPDAVPARVVDLDQRKIGIFVFQPELLEDFQAASAAILGRSQLASDATSKVGPLTIPSCGFVCFAVTLPIDVRENRKAVAVF